MRVILYTGKGGVGKTSIAASTACKLAKEGKKVMIMSTDQAHSLSDSFDVKLSFEPTKIINNLVGIEIDTIKEGEKAWGNLQSYLKDMLSAKSSAGIEVEELLVFPGLEELFALFKILEIYEENIYDVLIVDCAPTGETLSLLKFPEMFGTFIENMLPLERKMVKVAGPVVEKVTKIPMPKDSVFSDIERLIDKLEQLQSLMLDKEKVSVRIVTTPEKIVIKEAKRNFTCMHLYDYNVDAIIVNKIYPKEALEGYFHKWVLLQEEGIQELKESFHDIVMFTIPLQEQEIKTIPILEKISTFYGDQDPIKVFCNQKIFKLYEQDGKQKMEISLPFVSKEEVDLSQRGGEIHLAIKNEKRRFLLPDTLRGLEIAKAKFENGMLIIEFE